MKKIKFLTIVALGSLIGATPAAASDNDYGYISSPFGTSNGAVMFYMTGTRTTPASCTGSGLGTRWAINASTPNGQAQLSVFLTAYAQRKRINIHGLGVCNIWGDTETVDFFVIEG